MRFLLGVVFKRRYHYYYYLTDNAIHILHTQKNVTNLGNSVNSGKVHTRESEQDILLVMTLVGAFWFPTTEPNMQSLCFKCKKTPGNMNVGL